MLCSWFKTRVAISQVFVAESLKQRTTVRTDFLLGENFPSPSRDCKLSGDEIKQSSIELSWGILIIVTIRQASKWVLRFWPHKSRFQSQMQYFRGRYRVSTPWRNGASAHLWGPVSWCNSCIRSGSTALAQIIAETLIFGSSFGCGDVDHGPLKEDPISFVDYFSLRDQYSHLTFRCRGGVWI